MKNHTVNAERIIANIATALHNNISHVCDEVLSSKYPSKKVAELNKESDTMLLYWIDCDDDRYDMKYNFTTEKSPRKFLIGKPWAKRDNLNGSAYHVVSIATVLKNEHHSGILIFHISLNQFDSIVKQIINKKNLKFAILNNNLEIIFNLNLEEKIKKDYFVDDNVFHSKFQPTKLLYYGYLLSKMNDYPLYIYCSYENKIDITSYRFFWYYVLAFIISIFIWLLFYLFLKNEFKKLLRSSDEINNTQNTQHIAELCQIQDKIISIKGSLSKCEEQKLKLVKKNKMLQDVAQGYLVEKEKINNSLVDLRNVLQKEKLEKIALKRHINYLEGKGS